MAKPLATYQAKRNFGKTTEPSGEGRVAPSALRRFVVQKHDATRLHYDLRLELDGVFKSWAVTRGPSLDPHDKRLAVEVEDHPLDYGDFEGTIPKGEYGGGTVQLWDRGTWDPEGGRTPDAMLAGGDLKFVLHGERLHGSWVLVRIKDRKGGGKRINWLLIKHRDEAAREGDADALLALDRSVASGRTLAAIAAGQAPAPKPFMTAPAPKADAVWDSRQGVAADQRAAGPERAAAVVKATKPKLRYGPKATAAAAMPGFVPPQLCTNVPRPPSGSGWVHEVKFDGYRVQLRVEGGVATLRTRNGHDWTARFPALAEAASHLPDALLDGEVVALDAAGAPDFAALQAALAGETTGELLFYAFDLLFEAGADRREQPLGERKARLKTMIESVAKPRLRFVEHFETGGDAILKSACRLSLEGIVSKRLEAPYGSGRSEAWTKAKCRAGHEVVIGAWTTNGGAFRSLLVGVRKEGHLVYLGRVGTGFGEAKVAHLLPRLKAAAAKTSPFSGKNAPRNGAEIHWVRPDLVAEIEFAGWTGDGMVRQGSFKGLREDKPAAEVEAEDPAPVGAVGLPEADARLDDKPAARRAKTKSVPSADPAPAAKASSADPVTKPAGRYAPRSGGGAASVMGVPITHPDKALWPEAGSDGAPVTKLDLARYYEAVGAWMMPHIRQRPCSIIRAPDGFAREQFFQRHAMASTSSLLELMTISGDRKPYLAIDRIEGLAAVAQVAALELHPSNCAPGAPDVPGRLVFDLDPGPDVPFTRVVEAALTFRERLEALGLEGFCKTTGGKGLHVVTPLAPPKRGGPDWGAAKAFAQAVCLAVAKDEPARYVVNMAKKLRVGKIYLDYLRNDRLSTAVAPLSPRARVGAPVSMPVTWAEVKPGLDPMRYTLRTVPALLSRTTAWADYEASARPLAPAIKRLGTVAT